MSTDKTPNQEEKIEVERLLNTQDLGIYPDLKGKVVVITGGSSGIGAGISEAFVAQGARVVIISRDQRVATNFCDQIEKDYGILPMFFSCDLQNIEKLREVLNLVHKKYGIVDVLINNAANDHRHTLSDLSIQEWERLMNINLRPTFFLAQMVVEAMKKKGSGVIINLSSNSQMLGLSGYPAYVAAKGAITSLTRALARELGPSGIRVNTLVPGWVMTQRQKKLWVTKEDLKECIDQQSIKSTIQLHHIASCALFLASKAAAMVTCQTLVVDGGRA